jgi:hypothetical protein
MRLSELEQRLAVRDGELARVELEVREMRASTSWRVTAPLRAVSRGIGRLLRRPGPVSPETTVERGTAPKPQPSESPDLRWAEVELSVQRYRHIVAARLRDPDKYRDEISAYRDARAKGRAASDPKIAVFTAIAGAYDALTLPSPLDPAYDYIVFADSPVADTGIYDIRAIPYKHEDPTRVARWVKTHALELLAGYDVAIWIDANIAIVDDIGPMLRKFLESGAPAGAVPHPYRGNVDEEFDACIQLMRDDVAVIEAQRAYYRDNGFDGGAIFETGLLMMDLHHPALAKFLASWWTQIERFSRRDQLSVGWALRDAQTSMHLLMQFPTNVRSHSCFCYVPHSANDASSSALLAALGATLVEPRSTVGPLEESS